MWGNRSTDGKPVRKYSALPVYLAAAAAECVMLDIFAHAGFDWRNPCMEYTLKGRWMTAVLSMLPLMFLAGVWGLRCMRFRRSGKAGRLVLRETAVCLACVCAVFLTYFFLTVWGVMPELFLWVRLLLIRLIENSDWMRWPPP